MDALSISSNVELNEFDAYVASMKYIYLLVKGIIEIIKNGVNTLMRGILIPIMKVIQNCSHNSTVNIIYPAKTVIHGYAN